MTIWRPSLAGATGPKFKRIADAIGADIAGGALASGARLPTQRDLAEMLGVSLNTVSRAYADAIERGFLQGEIGRGTFVRDAALAPPEPGAADLTRSATGPIDFSRNLPAPGPSAAALAGTLAELSGSDGLAALLDLEPAEASERRASIAASWLGRAGFDARGAQIVFATGAQHGLLASLLATTRSGDVLLTEALTYAPVTAMARRLGLRIEPVALEGGALCPDALAAACERVSARALYCLPTLQTPTTATLDAERRAAVAEIARARGLTLIEDDVFGMLPERRPPSLASFAPERTIYLSSASKSMAPGLRVGFLHAPDALVEALRAAIRLSCWTPPPLTAEIACRWIESGEADRLNLFQRREAEARQALAREILSAASFEAHPQGLHLWLRLPSRWRAGAFRAEAAARGVLVLEGESFAAAGEAGACAVRLCLGHEASRARVRRGLEILAALLADAGQSGALVL